MKKPNTKKIKKNRKTKDIHKAKKQTKAKAPKIKIKNTQKNITSRGGLISVLKFMDYIGYETLFEKNQHLKEEPMHNTLSLI